MNDELVLKMQRVSYVNSQIASALIELEAMKAENANRSRMNQAQAYTEEAFMELINKYQLGHNSVLSNLEV